VGLWLIKYSDNYKSAMSLRSEGFFINLFDVVNEKRIPKPEFLV
jgi:hypothetical protein